MSCCEEYIDLGCIGSCAPDVKLTGLVLGSRIEEQFKAYVDFPSGVICMGVYEGGDGVLFLETDAKLNEDYTHKIKIFYNGQLESCYKVTIKPEICK